MSWYVEWTGEVIFPDLCTFEKAAKDIKTWVTLDKDHGDGCIAVNSYKLFIDKDKKIIRIPPWNYRNFRWTVHLDHNVKGWLVGVSGDGCFDGYAFKDGKWYSNDLRVKYLEEHKQRPHPIDAEDTEECQGFCDACSEFDYSIQNQYLEENRGKFSIGGILDLDYL